MIIISTDSLKEISTKILNAVDSSEISTITETLAINVKNKAFTLSVTNKEYFVKVSQPIDTDIEFKATVNAHLFLKLVAQITTEVIEFELVDNTLQIKGNGTYSLPLIFDNDGNLLELPEINIDNITTEFNIDTAILSSINTYNSKELVKVQDVAQSVQRMYYVDDKGCITFNTGACVNNFSLASPVKLLLNNRLVKLFKLFNTEQVHFCLGYDELDGMIQTKVCFKTDEIEITSILYCDDTLLSSVPVDAIRARANTEYSQSITINREAFLQLINRLLIFSAGYGTSEILKSYCKFTFTDNYVEVFDAQGKNNERLAYEKFSGIVTELPYTCILDLKDLKLTLETCKEAFVNIAFGDSISIVVERKGIQNIIPEIHDMTPDE